MGKLKLRIMGWLSRPLPPCKEITENLSASLDRPLTWREKILTRLHLFTCEWCTNYGRQIGFLDEAVKNYTQQEEFSEKYSQSLSKEARQSIKNALKKNQGNS